ncbi:hypothetical protein HYS48_02695 [Candidatus Woesearchaeota archaeon]|nr:hypothetical protein [Candidatus Woesearchaeota archaeon]
MGEPSKLEHHIATLCRQIIDRRGWNQFRDIQVEVQPQLASLGAHIKPEDWQINVLVGQDFYEAVEAVRKDEDLSLTPDQIIASLMEMLVVHERGHFWHCPKNRDLFEQIVQGHFEAIQGREYREERIQQLCFMLHNLFSDTILNTVNAHTDVEKDAYRQGLDLFFLQGWNYMRRELKQRGDKSIKLHIAANQLLGQTDPAMGQRMRRYMPKLFLSFERYKHKLLNIFTGDEALTDAVLRRDVSPAAAGELVERLRDTSLWKPMAYAYANLMYPFMQRDMDAMQQCTENSFTREEKQRGSGGKEQKQSSTSKKEKKEEREGGKKNLIQELIERLMTPHTPYSSPLLVHFQRLDALYKQRAGKISLFAQEPEEEAPHLEHPTSVEEMPITEFRPKETDWSSTRIYTRADGTRKVELYRRINPLILPFAVQETPGGIPDISFIFDSSSSMDFEPFEKEGSGQYHYAVLAFYSILRFLEEEGIAPLLNYHTINFSNSTVSSGWCSYGELERAKKALFDYQGSATMLDPQELAKMRRTRRDNVVCFMLTDSQFNLASNAKAILREIDAMLSTGGIGVYLFQIGSPTPFSKALEQRGVPVHPIESTEDFLHMGIRFTRDLYGEVAR